MSQAVGAQIFCFKGFEQHGQIAADEDRAGRKTSQYGKGMTVHDLNRLYPNLVMRTFNEEIWNISNDARHSHFQNIGRCLYAGN